MNTAITKIVQVDSLGGSTPARVHRPSGTMFIDKRKFAEMPADERFYVLLHEAGHATLNTRNEDLADDFASKQYINAGYPLSGSVRALTRNLGFNKPGHWERANNQLDRALKYDKINNTMNFDENTTDSFFGKRLREKFKARRAANRGKRRGMFLPRPPVMPFKHIIANRAHNDPRFELSFSGMDGDMNDFLGLGKKARERRKDKRSEKQQFKLERIEARADASVRKRGAGGGIGDAIGGIVGSIFGGNKGDGAAAEQYAPGGVPPGGPAPVPANKNKTMIIAGVAILVVIVVILFVVRKKK